MAPLFLTTSAFDTGGHTRYNMRMAGNTYGTVFRVTTFGESHGDCHVKIIVGGH